MNKDVTSEIKNQTGIITINTADGLNVINRMMLSDIAETITAMDLNDAVKAIIIRGSDKAFSTGIDVNEFVENINAAVLEEMYENFEKIADVKKPVIAAVSGYALGIGFELALACDIIFASESLLRPSRPQPRHHPRFWRHPTSDRRGRQGQNHGNDFNRTGNERARGGTLRHGEPDHSVALPV